MSRDRPFAGLPVSALHRAAKSADWRCREDVAFELRARVEADWKKLLAVLRKWLSDADPGVRRAAVVACMVRKKYGTPEAVESLLRELEVVLGDGDSYVRRNLGPFVLGYLGYTYPGTALDQLRRWFKRFADGPPYVCYNLASAFSQALGRRHPEAAVELLSRFAKHPSALVRRAVVRGLLNAAVSDPALVLGWCRQHNAAPEDAVANEVITRLGLCTRSS